MANHRQPALILFSTHDTNLTLSVSESSKQNGISKGAMKGLRVAVKQ